MESSTRATPSGSFRQAASSARLQRPKSGNSVQLNPTASMCPSQPQPNPVGGSRATRIPSRPRRQPLHCQRQERECSGPRFPAAAGQRSARVPRPTHERPAQEVHPEDKIGKPIPVPGNPRGEDCSQRGRKRDDQDGQGEADDPGWDTGEGFWMMDGDHTPILSCQDTDSQRRAGRAGTRPAPRPQHPGRQFLIAD